MANINELLARAAALRDETMLNSISPERAGGIMYDTLLAMNELWLQQGAALVISKIYASVAAMEADTAPVSDLTGLPLRPGQIVVIASSDSDNGSVYRYNGTSSPSWSLVGEIGNLEPVDSLDSDSTSLPLAAHQGKVLDGKISQLGQYVDNQEWVEVVTDSSDKVLYGVKTDGKFYFGDGCPPQIQDYVTNVLGSYSASDYADVMTFLGNLIDGDSLTTLLATKVDNVVGKSLIDSNVASSLEVIDNPEFIEAKTDSEGKILEAITTEGRKQVNIPTDMKEITIKGYHIGIIDNSEYVSAIIDSENKLLSGIKKNGHSYFAGIESPTIDDIISEIGELYSPSNILVLNPRAELLPVFENYKHHLSNNTPNGVPPTDYQNLSLVWFSDIHSDGEQLKRIVELCNEYNEHIDDVICTGDVVRQTWADDFSYWHKQGGDRVLFVNGNHDTYKLVGGTIKTYYSAQAGYQKYIEPFLSSTQYTECPEGKMYWVKDYPESKIRIIAVDVMHLNEKYDDHTDDTVRETGVYQDGGLVDNGEQLAWFVEKLAEAKTNEYQVICAAHYPAQRYENKFIKCTFSTLLFSSNIGGQLQSDFQDAVQDFINGGGEFICWMCGHHHQDEFFLSENYPDQLCVVVDCDQRNLVMDAMATRANSFQSIVKPDKTKARDSFNIINIEPRQKLIRLYRIGTQYDTQNRRIGSLVYDYQNKEMIYN